MATVELRDVAVRFQNVTALDSVSLDIRDGEMLSVIGPSGSGKTTLLRVVAGLDEPESGDVLIDGESVVGRPPSRRGLAMVFQDQVMYPGRDVEHNVSFPLEVAGVPAEEIKARVMAESRVMAIDRFLDRMPATLSTGHQQLVQIARALVTVPRVFLLDEPLAQLDAHSRVRMRQELVLLQRGYGVTAIYVTNDPVEAMAVANRVAVLSEGRLLQVGTPAEVYHRPQHLTVASLTGDLSVVEAMVRWRDGGAWITVSDWQTRAWAPSFQTHDGSLALLAVRPERWRMVSAGGLVGRVDTMEFLGSHVVARVVLLDGQVIRVIVSDTIEAGTTVHMEPTEYYAFHHQTHSLIG